MLNGLNQNRLNNALPPVHYVWCKICRQPNDHLWWNCPNVRCNICNQAHSTYTCPYINACQWCGNTNHSSALCNNVEGLKLKASCKRRCFRCGRFGHIAVNCTAMTRMRCRRIRRRRWRRRFRRRRR